MKSEPLLCYVRKIEFFFKSKVRKRKEKWLIFKMSYTSAELFLTISYQLSM